ncbi:hypothetical protein CAOG_008252 [Capsaspora owczarzaki ATCC 30864]|uniref:Uncharacterized protein n=1 Tax=Capsaspora owczarzaki (strain ATCC 30864) TaxID=595528 RepID=A0A0D2W1Q1_CAPO3|nr:hypothetical protein CAOG_008252 [Capsaspora owczarzaki ATCC 30864]
MTLHGNAELVDLAVALKDGTVLCALSNRILAGSVSKVHRQPRLQFLCYENIANFLDACVKTFGLKRAELFATEDLYYGSNFGKIITTLDKLSKTPFSAQAGLLGILPSAATGGTQGNAAARRPTAARPVTPAEDLYGTLPDMLDTAQAKSNRAQAGPQSIPGLMDDYTTPSDIDDVYQGMQDLQRARGTTVRRQQPTNKAQQAAKHTARLSTISHAQRDAIPVLPDTGKRSHIINELMSTEAYFVASLDMIEDFFYKPLVSFLDAQTVSTLFCNLKQLLQVHTDIMEALISSIEDNQGNDIAKALVDHSQQLMAYGEYCANLPDAMNLLQELQLRPEFVNRMLAIQEQSQQKFRLGDLLNIPMQRILKYPLLLKELRKCTPESHPDSDNITAAMTAMESVATFINDTKRDKEYLALAANLTDMIEGDTGPLISYGKLLRDGDLEIRTKDDSKPKQRYIFLFETALIVCSIISPSKYRFKKTFNLVGGTLEDVAAVPGLPIHAWSFKTADNSQNCLFMAKTQETKRVWLSVLKKIVNDLTELENAASSQGIHKGSKHMYKRHKQMPKASCLYCHAYIWGEGLRCQVCMVDIHLKCIGLIHPYCSETRQHLTHANNLDGADIKGGSLTAKARTWLKVKGGGTVGKATGGAAVTDPNGPTADLSPRPGPAVKPRPNVTGLFPPPVAPYQPPPANQPVQPQVQPVAAPEGESGDAFVAVENFAASNDDELDFAVGDTVMLLERTTEDWWLGSVRGRQGYFPAVLVQPAPIKPTGSTRFPAPEPVPAPQPPRPTATSPTSSSDLEGYSWFHGPISKVQTHDLLVNETPGTFLVRQSETGTGCTLSLNTAAGLKHVRIKPGPDGAGFCLADTKVFPSVQDLIAYYLRESLAQHFTQLDFSLKATVPRRLAPAPQPSISAPRAPVSTGQTKVPVPFTAPLPPGVHEPAVPERKLPSSPVNPVAPAPVAPKPAGPGAAPKPSGPAVPKPAGPAAPKPSGPAAPKPAGPGAPKPIGSAGPGVAPKPIGTAGPGVAPRPGTGKAPGTDSSKPLAGTAALRAAAKLGQTSADAGIGSKDQKPVVQALYSYQAKHPDELELSIGDSIEVHEMEDSGWWKGRIIGKSMKVGVFPSTYVTDIHGNPPPGYKPPVTMYPIVNAQAEYSDVDEPRPYELPPDDDDDDDDGAPMYEQPRDDDEDEGATYEVPPDDDGAEDDDDW